MTEKMMNDEVAAWFTENRGIRKDTLEAFGLYTNGYGDVVIPYSNGEKLRPNPTVPLREGQPRFSFTKGKTPDLFVCPALEHTSTTAFLVEGETDAMRLWQELVGDAAGENIPAVFGLSGINTWRQDFASAFSEFDHVYVILDNDFMDYTTAARVDHVWLHQIYPDLKAVTKVKRVRLPDGVKDVCEFFETFDLEALRIQVGRTKAASRFRPLDMSKAPPEPNWLVEGLIARGDVTLLSGLGSLGKSMLTMGLTVASIEEWDYFLGHKMKAWGSVLYIDEENPEDVVYNRLFRMGLQRENIGQLRYLWNNGIFLDRVGDALLEEALDFEPAVICIDSLTRVHTKEENNTGDMAHIMNECIKPLARQTGAAVVVIHHHDKNANGPRGAGDIFNSVDASLDAFETTGADLMLRLKKTRRRKKNDSIRVSFVDKPDGTLAFEFEDYSKVDLPF